MIWTNNFRLLLGMVFFINFTIMLFFKIYVNSGYEIALMLGLYFFVYAILSRYYLTMQMVFNLGELIFLSGFLAILDLLFVTGFVYFTGAAESPYFVLYLLNLAAVMIEFPYFPQSVFIWSLCATALYDSILFMTLMVHPLFTGFMPGSERAWPVVYRLTLINGVGVPAMFFFFSGVAYYITGYVSRFRKNFEKMIVNELSAQEEIAALSNISWILTKVNDVNYMLQRILEETFKVLRISSGAVLLIEPNKHHYTGKVSICVPSPLMDYFFTHDPSARITDKDPGLKKILEQEKIQEHVIKPIMKPGGKQIGKIIFFARNNEGFSQRGLFLLDSIINELSISLSYAMFCERLPLIGRKGKRKKSNGS